MRIGIFTDTYPPFINGVSTSIKMLENALRKKGHKVYIVTVNLKQSKMDHYSVFSTLMNKYGKPDYLNPEKSEWNDDKIIMTLERPLTLKYVDKLVFEKIQSESMVKKSAEEESRQEFLNSL